MESTDLVVCPVCQSHAYGCDACMHAHLVRRHAVRYSEVFGQAPDAWSGFCTTHASCMNTMMGL